MRPEPSTLPETSAGRLPPPRAASTGWPSVSVVVPVHGGAARFPACLEALTRQDYPGDWELLVVENQCDVPLEPLVAKVPRARLLREPRPGSYVARNSGIRAAQGDVLAFTDADCEPEPGWLSAGVRALEEDPRCGLVAGRIRVTAEDPRRPTAAERYELAASHRQRDFVTRWRFGATANLFTRRSVMDAVGPFDPALRSLGDRDWGDRVHAAGYGMRHAEAAVVQHPARRTVGELLARVRRTSGGYFDLARLRRPPLRVLAHDAALGLAPGRVFSRGTRPLRDRLTLAAVAALVLAARGAEILRLALGGDSRRS